MKKNILTLWLVIILGQGVGAQSNDAEEIVVTATKIERTLQEVPVAVSVVTADTIENKLNTTFLKELDNIKNKTSFLVVLAIALLGLNIYLMQ